MEKAISRRSGLQVSRLCLGTMMFGGRALLRAGGAKRRRQRTDPQRRRCGRHGPLICSTSGLGQSSPLATGWSAAPTAWTARCDGAAGRLPRSRVQPCVSRLTSSGRETPSRGCKRCTCTAPGDGAMITPNRLWNENPDRALENHLNSWNHDDLVLWTTARKRDRPWAEVAHPGEAQTAEQRW